VRQSTAAWGADSRCRAVLMHNRAMLPNPISMNLLEPSGHYTYCTAVTTRTAQRSLYVRHSGHYYVYAPHSVHYIYNAAVTISTAQRSLYVPHSGHYMCGTAVTICTAQRSLYVPHSGHYMYRQFNIQQFYILPIQCIYLFCVDLRTNSDYFHTQH